jgi:uncharacterized protein (DUF427 family)
MKVKAIWNDEVIAETKHPLVVEGRHYFPQDTVKLDYLSNSDYCEECSWKGLAKYYNLEVAGEELPNAAYYYPNPKEEAIHISGYIAFGEGVEIKG